jgi:hypothetical protein
VDTNERVERKVERIERIVIAFTSGTIGFFLGVLAAFVLLGLKIALEHLG